jgi:REP element-mobilizing transposase RayT
VARHPRLELEAGIHHVYARGNERREIFNDDADRRQYLSRLADAVGRNRWRCLAYCLMPNHVHLLLETTRPNLGTGMRRLHGGYAQAFNARHERSGHLFQGRYGSVRVEDDPQLWVAAAYIAVNPVGAKLCRRPEHWTWSSHKAALDAGGAAPRWLDIDRLLWHFGAAGGDPRQRYADFVEDRLAIG